VSDRARTALFAVVLAGIGLGAVACSGRSVDAFCSTYYEQKAAYLGRYGNAGQQTDSGDPAADLLGNAAQLGSALGDIVIMFDRLSKVAPDDIEPDVSAIHDSLQKQIDGASGAFKDPFGTIGGGLLQGLTTMGSWQRLEDYVVVNCGERRGT